MEPFESLLSSIRELMERLSDDPHLSIRVLEAINSYRTHYGDYSEEQRSQISAAMRDPE